MPYETAQGGGNVIIAKAEATSKSLQKEVKCEIEAVKRSNPASSIYHRTCTPEGNNLFYAKFENIQFSL